MFLDDFKDFQQDATVMFVPLDIDAVAVFFAFGAQSLKKSQLVITGR